MRNLVIGFLFLLAAILFLSVDSVNAGNPNEFDKDVFGNTYILNDNGQRDGKIETDIHGNKIILNRYGLKVGELEHNGSQVIIY